MSKRFIPSVDSTSDNLYALLKDLSLFNREIDTIDLIISKFSSIGSVLRL